MTIREKHIHNNPIKSSYNDICDDFRLALKFYRFEESSN